MSKEKKANAKSDKSDISKMLKDKLAPSLNTKSLEQEKNATFIILEIIEYIPNSVVIKTIIKKTTGNVTVSSFDSGEALTEKTSPFDTFIQVIDGKAEIVINGQSHILNTGESIIIPAHSSNIIKANTRFKIISTVIKSGYDEVSI
ncbi:cupin domain-containing protein [Mesohalobacter salilacus]|uniref:cupin domain-containing protein n=1 Tax=Mesohalobacter salilacus TaxID=2491711 RepID=UPI0026D5B909